SRETSGCLGSQMFPMIKQPGSGQARSTAAPHDRGHGRRGPAPQPGTARARLAPGAAQGASRP
ncbi:hypothetical protein, partial [Dactylosporangium fulvum]|uniref:hypothetical protein n=1 Tax=Dactylosporangium fulvum TaxID=53359 RepID=UPI0031D17F24